jgi:DNA-binding transcriptional LysR family regulator
VLREEPFVVLTPASLKAKDAHTVLAQEPFIRLDRNVYAGQLIDAYLRKAGIRPKERFEFDGLELIAVMVDRGMGVSLLPDWPLHGRKASRYESFRFRIARSDA